MEQFDLSCPLSESRENICLVVQCLPPEPPNSRLLYGWDWHTRSAVENRFDELEQRLETIGSEGREGRDKILVRQEELLDELHELRELTQRQFINAFRREQEKIESHCPNVFVLRPKEGNKWLKGIAGQKLELQLYCQAQDHWHPAGTPYVINESAKWLKAVSPYLRGLVKVLKYVKPFIGPGIGMTDSAYSKLILNDIALMQALIDKLPEVEDADTASLAGEIGVAQENDARPSRFQGSALRALRELLDELDPNHHWGELQKTLMPEGHYLWLCERHVQQPGRV